MTFRDKVRQKVEAWKAEHDQSFCPRDVKIQLEEELRAIDPPARRGFAALSSEDLRAVASRGGATASARGNSHRFTPETAQVAGASGGKAAHAYGTAHRFTPEEARVANRASRKVGEQGVK